MTEFLTFEFQNVTFGINISSVKSIEMKMDVVNVPDSPPFVKGIASLHGEVIAVYSLAARFGYPETDVQNTIIVEIGGMKVGLEVQKVKEILSIDDDRLTTLPAIMEESRSEFEKVAESKKGLVVMLRPESLISVSEQNQIAMAVQA